MAAVKKIKKAQNGAKRADNLVTEKKMMPKFIDIEGKRVKGPISDKIDIVARKKAIKDGKFREDLKSGDLFPVKKNGGKASKKKMQYGGAAASMVPPMKSGGKMKKCKYGCK